MRSTIIFGLLCLLGAEAYGSLYGWVDTIRPPVSLIESLKLADRKLGSDRDQFYCLNASITGNQEGDGKRGVWNLIFAAEDGSRRTVFVDMQGNVETRIDHGPIDLTKTEGRRTDLHDLHDKLIAVFDSLSISPDVVVRTEDSLTVSYSTRDFLIHAVLSDGEYSQQAEKVIGPTARGVWIHVIQSEQRPPRTDAEVWSNLTPYWSMQKENFILANGNGFITVEIRSGRDFPTKQWLKIYDAFGESTETYNR